MANRFEAFRLLGPVNLQFPSEGRLFPEPPDSTIGIKPSKTHSGTADSESLIAGMNGVTIFREFGRDFNPSWFKGLNDQDKLEVRLTRRFLLNVFDVKNLSQIYESSENSQRREEIYARFVENYGIMAGMEGLPFREKEQRIQQAFRTAQGVIRSFENPETGLLRNYRTSLTQKDEISTMNDPIELLRVCFSPEATRRQRFEARRKLVLADMALKVDLATEPMDRNMHDFLGLLNNLGVWNTATEFGGGAAGLGGNSSLVEVISEHSPVNYACEDVYFLQDGEPARISDYRRYTPFQMREWTDIHGKKKKVHFEHRIKDDISYMLKMMRKDTADPNLIDDYQGIKLVFPKKRDIGDFLEMLQEKTTVTFDEVKDTISNNDKYRVANVGSSEDYEVVKVHALIQGMKVEFQCHTIRTHMDSRYRDEIGAEEFIINRLFDRGIMSLLYPEDIYGIDVSELKDSLVQEQRSKVRTPAYYLPVERRDGIEQIRYDQQDIIQDCAKIIDQMEEMPDTIIAISSTGMLGARVIADRLQISDIREYDEDSLNDIAIQTAGKQVLIVDAIGDRYTRVRQIKDLIPDAMVAVLAKRSGLVSPDDDLADYSGREISVNQRLVFVEEQQESNKRLARVHAVGLIYKIVDGQIYYYVQKKGDDHNFEYKLPGGRREDEDNEDLRETLGREFREESDISDYMLEGFYKLSDFSFQYKVTDGTGYRKGFTRAFGLKVDDTFSLTSWEDDISGFEWVSPEEFAENSNQESYQQAITKWTGLIKTVENLE